MLSLNNLNLKEDLSTTMQNALTAWKNGAISWGAWFNSQLLCANNIAISGLKMSATDFLAKTASACASSSLSFENVEISDEKFGLTHLQMTAKITDLRTNIAKDYHICLSVNDTLFSRTYDLEVVSPEMQNDVTVCHCAEYKMRKFVPAFA